jgi:hypothetical protein
MRRTFGLNTGRVTFMKAEALGHERRVALAWSSRYVRVWLLFAGYGCAGKKDWMMMK